ncbi:hypothetical protein [Rhodoglobus sp.]
MIRARIEVVAALVLGALTVATLVQPTWIEMLIGLEPDGGNGESEWLVVAVLAIATVAVAALANRDWRSARRRQHEASTAS